MSPINHPLWLSFTCGLLGATISTPSRKKTMVFLPPVNCSTLLNVFVHTVPAKSRASERSRFRTETSAPAGRKRNLNTIQARNHNDPEKGDSSAHKVEYWNGFKRVTMSSVAFRHFCPNTSVFQTVWEIITLGPQLRGLGSFPHSLYLLWMVAKSRDRTT